MSDLDTGEEVLYSDSPSMFRNDPLRFLLCLALCLVIIGIPIMIIWYLKCIGTVLTVTNKRTTLRKGLLSKSTNEVWHDAVRNVQLSQSMFQRIFSTGTLAISSAGQSGMEIEVKGIPNPNKAKEAIDQNR